MSHAITVGFVLAIRCALPAGARRPPRDELPHPARRALGGRRLGTAATCLLLGGTIYTSYTYIAVPGLMFGTVDWRCTPSSTPCCSRRRS